MVCDIFSKILGRGSIILLKMSRGFPYFKFYCILTSFFFENVIKGLMFDNPPSLCKCFILVSYKVLHVGWTVVTQRRVLFIRTTFNKISANAFIRLDLTWLDLTWLDLTWLDLLFHGFELGKTAFMGFRTLLARLLLVTRLRIPKWEIVSLHEMHLSLWMPVRLCLHLVCLSFCQPTFLFVCLFVWLFVCWLSCWF